MIKIILALIVLIMLSKTTLFAQRAKNDTLKIERKDPPLKLKSFIIPAALVTYGVIGLNNNGLQSLNLDIRDKITANVDKKTTIDNYIQYAPAISVYGLNLAGIKGKNDFKDRTIILAMSYLLMGGVVSGTKSLAKEKRPDSNSYNSFPSGHTASAFVGAEFLWQEYKDVSIWYGITGYAVAASTGALRMYNNRHWLTDVAAGAGIGMASTKVSYLLYPYLKRTFSKKQKESMTLITPYYNGKQVGFNLCMVF